ncbi:MAG: DUF456 domain-containing protein [Bacteroidetes bacterium]|nr:MAG: DUF456 domain-containing protein [Bacteroidota bacterium]
MDIVLIILAFVFLVIGIIGSVLPALPGPPLAFVGLFITYYTTYQPISVGWLIVYGLLVTALVLVDLWLPALATKFTGGSSKGATGANIGMLLGIFIPIPLGIFVGAFLGSFIGELQTGKTNRQAFTAALGVFIGLIGGILLKVLFCLVMLIHLTIGLLL